MTEWGASIPRVIIPNPSLDVVEAEGGQHGWTWAVPLPYRVLSAPWSGPGMPAAPRDVGAHDGHFEHQLGYYACLQSFLTYSFGWTRPDKGLLWWYQHGRPTTDRRFRLIRDVWEADGTLLGFVSWLSSQPPSTMSKGTLNRWATRFDASPLPLDPTWRSRLRQAIEEDPWMGGGDPFHLGEGWHVAGPSQAVAGSKSDGNKAPPRLVGLDESDRTATFVSDTITGWYVGLAAPGDELPSVPGGRSWRVDVFVKPIGFLGVYRRSRDTGLWFAGQHRYHSVGN